MMMVYNNIIKDWMYTPNLTNNNNVFIGCYYRLMIKEHITLVGIDNDFKLKDATIILVLEKE